MPALSSIRPTLTYEFFIYPFADDSRQLVTISNQFRSDSTIFYLLESFQFQNDVFNPIQEGSAKIAQLSYGKVDLFKYVKGGDILFIKENGTPIFSGYIESIQMNINTNSGTSLTLYFCNLIKFISKSKVFGQILNIIQSSQNIKFSQFLNNISQSTPIGYSALFTGNSNGFYIYAGSNENANIILYPNNNVFVTITSFMSILQAIVKIIYPYQRFIYQNSFGEISISPLSLFNDLQWQFDQNNEDNFIKYTDLSVKVNDGDVFNGTYATLFNIPIYQSDLGNEQSLINSGILSIGAPSSQYFSRLAQLRASGNFVLTDVIIEDLIGDNNKLDTTLNNISELLQGGTNLSNSVGQSISIVNQTPSQQIPRSSNGGPDVSTLLFNYAYRSMAEKLIDQTQIFITSPRVAQTVPESLFLLPLPINKIVNINLDSGILDTTAMFCRGYYLNYSEGGTTVVFNLCKPLTGAAYWVNGELVRVG